MRDAQPAIELRDIGVLIDRRWIVRGINWSLEPGEIGAILGPNGCGKSTLARIIAGHCWPSEGEVRLLGEGFGETSLAELRKHIRLVQAAGPYDVADHLATRQVVETGFFSSLDLYQRPTRAMKARADRLLSLVGLSHVLDHPYRTLSSGEKVRCLIARALAERPRLLVLDEPTAGMDLLAREQVLATIEALRQEHDDAPAVVLITHHVEELSPCTASVLLMSGGKVVAQGRPGEVLRRESLSAAYGCPLSVRRAHGRYYVQVHPSAWTGLLGA